MTNPDADRLAYLIAAVRAAEAAFRDADARYYAARNSARAAHAAANAACAASVSADADARDAADAAYAARAAWAAAYEVAARDPVYAAAYSSAPVQS